ncbi:MAG: hypothetical protein LBT41_00040, partial [Candidatus Methanoplasma sp.]|jgi:hypothetical protein|nr:hypothetical protein [Candidatus Methanoplasma sp.]
MNIQALVKLSDAGTVEADWSDDRVTVTASGIGGNVMSNIDPFIGGVSGSDISVKITKTAGRVVLDMRSTSGDLIESLESARDENGGLRIDVQGGRDPIILDGSEVEGIINVIKRGIGP